jgi:hypothetical protein
VQVAYLGEISGLDEAAGHGTATAAPAGEAGSPDDSGPDAPVTSNHKEGA